jgi:hypothetical protein
MIYMSARDKPVRPQHKLLLALDVDLHARLAAVASVEGRSVSEVCRAAIADYVERRRRSPRFQTLLHENLARHQEMLQVLRDDD